ncbi:hypothetical protein SDC9_150753 [bioreactor metagenome]|uniref:Uncharacterized protein n=1 Tax=bioreactor metagenome TaxID=1076179 RepID=A0A645ESM9_9ZZZZ
MLFHKSHFHLSNDPQHPLRADEQVDQVHAGSSVETCCVLSGRHRIGRDFNKSDPTVRIQDRKFSQFTCEVLPARDFQDLTIHQQHADGPHPSPSRPIMESSGTGGIGGGRPANGSTHFGGVWRVIIVFRLGFEPLQRFNLGWVRGGLNKRKSFEF